MRKRFLTFALTIATGAVFAGQLVALEHNPKSSSDAGEQALLAELTDYALSTRMMPSSA